MKCFVVFPVVFPEFISTDGEPSHHRFIQWIGRDSRAGGGAVWKIFDLSIVPVAPWENDSGLTALTCREGNYIPAECERCGQ